MNIEIEFQDGENKVKKTIEINQFPALDGWDIQQRFVEFAASLDKGFRRAYTLEVLAYASVQLAKDRSMPLTTSAMIQNHLGGWKNVELVFEEVLRQNGIDPKTHADRPVFWEKVGAEMAASFVAELTRIMGPAIGMMAAKSVEP